MTATINLPYPWPTNFDGYSGQPAVATLGTTGQAPPVLQTGQMALSSTTTNTALTTGGYVVIDGELTLSGTGIVSGNAWGVRGQTTMSGTVTGGAFIFGVYGKLVLSGTENHADSRMAAAFFKLDASAGTCTAGQLSGIWVDMGATGPAGGFANGQTNVIRAQNTTSSAVNAIFYGYGKATYAMDLSGNSGGWTFTTGTAATAAGGLKIAIEGNVRYIQTYSGVGSLA